MLDANSLETNLLVTFLVAFLVAFNANSAMSDRLALLFCVSLFLDIVTCARMCV